MTSPRPSVHFGQSSGRGVHRPVAVLRDRAKQAG